ncbi:MAG: hypothetical protein U5K56_12930 [Halioglobus sp.]|nr:hypothetical protein [Halioglobus sp.]
MAGQLVAAQIAAGDLYAAEAQLDQSHFAGDEWLVVGALLDDGQPRTRRTIFDRLNPWDWYDDGQLRGDDAARRWAEYAVVLLDEEQIERRIRMPGSKAMKKSSYSLVGHDQEYYDKLRFELARATLRHDPNRDVGDIARD